MVLVPEISPRLGIAAGGWLVQQQQLRIGQRAGPERKPLLPAAGEFAGKLPLASRKSESLDHLLRGAARITHAIEARDEFQVLAHREVLIQGKALRHVADLALDAVGVAADVVAEAGALAPVGRQQYAEHADGRGLAASVGAEEAVDAAALHLHRQLMHHLAAAERFRQSLDVDADA